MVEKPAKVTILVAQWLANDWRCETIFNLKLSMKKRYEGVLHNLVYIQVQSDEHGINVQIQARQLYHGREEVAVHVRRIWVVVDDRCDKRQQVRPGRRLRPTTLSVRLLPKKL